MAPPKRNTSSTTSSVPTPPTPTTTTSSSKTHSPSSSYEATHLQILHTLSSKYTSKTPPRVKILDAFLVFLMVVGAVQFLYCVVGGNYPFNAFLSGFSATVGQFVLTASLRIQTNEENKGEFVRISHERAFADYVFGSMILHFFCVNFIN